MSCRAPAALATSGVSWLAWLTWVCRARSTPRAFALVASRSRPAQDLGLEEVLGQAHQALGGQADVADVVDVEQGRDELLQHPDRQVGHVAAGHDHVAHARGAAQVVEDLLVAGGLLDLELVLGHLGGGVADQVHAGAVAAVLGAGGQQLGQDLGRVAVGQALDRPHVGLVQAVAGRQRVAGPLGVAVVEGGQHVAAHRVGPEVPLVHGVEHLGREQHRHGGPLGLVLLDRVEQVGREQVAEDGHQLAQVLDRMGPLPLGRLPLGAGDVAEAGQPGPVGLDPLPLERVGERLGGGVRPRDTGEEGTGISGRRHRCCLCVRRCLLGLPAGSFATWARCGARSRGRGRHDTRPVRCAESPVCTSRPASGRPPRPGTRSGPQGASRPSPPGRRSGSAAGPAAARPAARAGWPAAAPGGPGRRERRRAA